MRLLLFTGFSGFTQRLDNVANLIQQQFDAEIDALVYGEANYAYLRERGKASYGDLWCVEHLFRDVPPTMPEQPEELRRWEYKLGHSLTKLLYSERTFVQHTHSLPLQRQLSQGELITHLLYLMPRLDKFLKDKDFVYVYTPASLISELLFYLARSRGIGFATMNQRRLGYQWSICRNNLDVHEELMRVYGDPNFRTNDAGWRRLREFQDGLTSGNKDAIQAAYQHEHLRQRRLTPGNLMGFVRRSFISRRKRFYLAPSRFQRIPHLMRFKLRERYCLRHLARQFPERPYVYFPLSMIPEASTLIRGQRFYDQLSTIKSLSLELPVDWVLLVREHPSSIGTNPIGFYREAARIFNVRVVSPALDPTECIRRSQAVVTISGTTGMEALVLGKKTVVLGSAIYSQIDSVFSVDEISNVGAILRQPWEPRDEENQLADMARFASAMEESNAFEDTEGILWSKAAFSPDLCPVDTSLFDALKPHLNDVIEK